MDDPGPIGPQPGLLAVLAIVGLPLAVVLSFFSVGYWEGAASDCQVFEAGARFGANLFIFPGLAVLLWIAYLAPVVLIGRRRPAIGLLVGVCIALVIAYWFVSGTAGMIRADPDGQAFCPSGVPDWWPWWLPR